MKGYLFAGVALSLIAYAMNAGWIPRPGSSEFTNSPPRVEATTAPAAPDGGSSNLDTDNGPKTAQDSVPTTAEVAPTAAISTQPSTPQSSTASKATNAANKQDIRPTILNHAQATRPKPRNPRTHEGDSNGH
jgi:hypothetical protein